MTQAFVDEATLAEVLSRSGGWADIDSLYWACEEAGVFNGAKFKAHAREFTGKARIRQALKHGKIKDGDGNIIEVASIVMDDGSGKKQRVYKQETLFDVDDFVQVCRYWKDSARVSEEKYEEYMAKAIDTFGVETGRQIQRRLNLD